MTTENKTGPTRVSVWKMFDRIAHRYDLLNHVLSFGNDILWRRKMHALLPVGDKLHLLDLATGTGDQAISLLKRNKNIEKAIGVDLAVKMLEVGKQKAQRLGLERRLEFHEGDATALNYSGNKFDVVTISFGIRNVTDVSKALFEMHRVLKPQGRALILEFSLPKNLMIRQLYLFYFRNILPRLGAIISGDSQAYYYLNKTVETFPYGDDFCQLMADAGFAKTTYKPLTFGIATIYCGIKH